MLIILASLIVSMKKQDDKLGFKINTFIKYESC